MKKLLTAIALLTIVASAHAQTTFNFAFGILANSDGSTPMADGMLVQIIAAPTAGNFGAPSPTAFLNGTNETIIWSGALDSSTNGDIPGSMFTAVTATVTQGYALMLQWFPTLSSAASAPGYGTQFGQYGYAQDVSWVAPSAGSTVNISFLTDTVFTTGTADSLGYASQITAVPEPSTYAMIFGLAALVGVLVRRNKVKAA